MEEVCEEYRSSLSDLNGNSKPLINVLTMLAEENITYAPDIVKVIERHLEKASPEIKLPAIYLIDSIIKNVGGVYLSVFTQNIVSTFCGVFEKVDERTRMLLYKLRQTWTEIFPNKKLYAIDVRVKQIDPAWPITADVPAQHSIHVNPKFLGGNQKPPTTTTPVPVKDLKESSKDHEKQQAEVLKELLFKRQELLRLQKQKIEIDVLQNLKSKTNFQFQDKQRSNPTFQGPVVLKQDHPCQIRSEMQTKDILHIPTQDIRTQIPLQVLRSQMPPQGLLNRPNQVIEYQSCPQRTLSTTINMSPSPLPMDPRLHRIEGRFSQRDPRVQKVSVSLNTNLSQSSNAGVPEITKSTRESTAVGPTNESFSLNTETTAAGSPVIRNVQKKELENISKLNNPTFPKKASSNFLIESDVSNLVSTNNLIVSKSNIREVPSSQAETHTSSKLSEEEILSPRLLKINKSSNDKTSVPCGNLSSSENKVITDPKKSPQKIKLNVCVQKVKSDNRHKEVKIKLDKPREGALIVRLRPDPSTKEEIKSKEFASGKEENKVQTDNKFNIETCKENKDKQIIALKETNNKDTDVCKQNNKLENNKTKMDAPEGIPTNEEAKEDNKLKEINCIEDIKKNEHVRSKDISQKEDIKRNESFKSKDSNQKKDVKINEDIVVKEISINNEDICQKEDNKNKEDIEQKEDIKLKKDCISKDSNRNENKTTKEKKHKSKIGRATNENTLIDIDVENDKTKESNTKFKKTNERESKSRSSPKSQRSRIATYSNKETEKDSKKGKRSPRKSKDFAEHNVGMRLRSNSPSKFQVRVTRSQTRNRTEESHEDNSAIKDKSSSPTVKRKSIKDGKRKDTGSSEKSIPSGKRNCITPVDDANKCQGTTQLKVTLEPIEDTDLRILPQVSTSSNEEQTLSRQEKNKATKRELNDKLPTETNEDDNFKENDKEPPIKKIKEEQSTDSLFSGEDQDYRQLGLDPSPRSSMHKGWAQYKAAHEFRSPLRASIENNENSEDLDRQVVDDQDFRQRREKFTPVRSHHSREMYQPNDPRNWGYDRLGRPLLSRLHFDKSFNRFGYEQNHVPELKHTKATLMLSKQKEIIQHAQEQLSLGIMSREQYNDLSNELQKLKEQQYKRPYSHHGFGKHIYRNRKDTNAFQQNFDVDCNYRNHLNERKLPSTDFVRSHLPPPNSVTSIKVDNKLRKILFIAERCIIIMDNDEPREITFKGEPVPVFIDDMTPLTLNFDGEKKQFEVNGRSHSIKLGTPSREVYVDGYPYEAKFDGPPFVVFLAGKAHNIRLGGPPPRVHISEETTEELKKLMSLNSTDDCNLSLASDKPEMLPSQMKFKTQDIDLRTRNFLPSKTANEDLDLRHAEENINQGQDVDMRWMSQNKTRVSSQQPFNELNLEDFEVKSEPHSSMKDVDYRPSLIFSQDEETSDETNMIHVSTALSVAPVSGSESSTNQSALSQARDFKPLPPNENLLHPPPHWIQRCVPVAENWSNEERTNRTFLHPKSEWKEKENQMDWEYSDQEYNPYSPPSFRRKDQDKLPLMHSQESQREDRPSQSYYPGINVQEISQSRVSIPDSGWIESESRSYDEQELGWNSDRNSQKWKWGENAQTGSRHSPHLISDPGQDIYKLRKTGHQSQEDFTNYHASEGRGRSLPLHSVTSHRPLRPPMFGTSRRQGALQPHLNQRSHLQMFRPWYGTPPNHERDPRMNFMPRRGFVPFPRMDMRPPLLPIRPNSSLLPYPPAPSNEPSPAILPVPSTSSPLLSTPLPAASVTSDTSTTETQQTVAETPDSLGETTVTQPLAALDINALFEKLLAKGLINQQTAETDENKTEKEVVKEEEEQEEKETRKSKEAIPVIEFTAESLKVRRPKVVDALHQGTQCASCGMRFKDQNMDRYSQHLDWHFRVNRREKDGVKKAFSRKWFYDVEDWIQFEEFEDLEERARSFFELQASEEQYQVPVPVEVPSVPALGQETELCVMCSEPFQLFWVEEEEEWHLRDAVRHEGQAYHPLCLEDFKKATETPDTSIETIAPDAFKDEELVKKEASESEEVEQKENLEEELDTKEKIETSDGQVQEADISPDVIVSETEPAEESQVKEEEEEIKMDGKPGEEEIIGLITEDTPMEPVEPRPESKMVVLQSSGSIVMKVKAESIAQPSSPSPASQVDNSEMNNSAEEAEEIEFRPPTPDPRFQILPPVQIGKELSGLCSIM